MRTCRLPPPHAFEEAASELVDLEATIDGADNAALEAAAVEVWTKALDEVDSFYGARGWEILVVFVTVESGDVLIYPATMVRLEDNAAKFRVAVHSPTWANAYGAITAKPESRKFEVAYNKVLQSIVETWKHAIEHPAVASRFRKLTKRPKFGIYYVDAVEGISREQLTFLWGNKTPDGGRT